MSLSQSFYNPQIKPPQWGGPEVMATNVQRWYDMKGLPHPVGYWPFWERGGNRVDDLSGFGNYGIFTTGGTPLIW